MAITVKRKARHFRAPVAHGSQHTVPAQVGKPVGGVHQKEHFLWCGARGTLSLVFSVFPIVIIVIIILVVAVVVVLVFSFRLH